MIYFVHNVETRTTNPRRGIIHATFFIFVYGVVSPELLMIVKIVCTETS